MKSYHIVTWCMERRACLLIHCIRLANGACVDRRRSGWWLKSRVFTEHGGVVTLTSLLGRTDTTVGCASGASLGALLLPTAAGCGVHTNCASGVSLAALLLPTAAGCGVHNDSGFVADCWTRGAIRCGASKRGALRRDALGSGALRGGILCGGTSMCGTPAPVGCAVRAISSGALINRLPTDLCWLESLLLGAELSCIVLGRGPIGGRHSSPSSGLLRVNFLRNRLLRRVTRPVPCTRTRYWSFSPV